MKMKKMKMVLSILILVLAVSAVSAQQKSAPAQVLAQSAEAQAIGGADNCMRAIGLGLGLAVAALSPCSVVCASLAWYDLMLVAIYCG
jgi:hypothetical protein